MMLKLNGGRTVNGILRGFDPFMNVVIDETIEECRDGTKNNIGMVVRSTRTGRKLNERMRLQCSNHILVHR